MTMKKLFAGATLALVLAVSAAVAPAAELSNYSGQSCGSLTGTWHFVNNQVPAGSGPGTLWASWNGGATSCQTVASAVNKNTQHFYCTAPGTLDPGAYTNLGGRLVLSHFSCQFVEEPPGCDPKKEICK